jgi:putative chitinase
MTDATNGRPAGAAPNAPPRPEFVDAVGAAMTAVGCSNAARHAEYLGPLSIAAKRFRIVTKLRVAHWMAQVGHESGGLSRVVENLNYKTERQIAEIFAADFKSYKKVDGARIFDPEALIRAKPYVRNPEGLANFVYANQNGNGPESSGDGWRYRGRGPIQLTGLGNYLRAGTALALPFVQNPDMVAEARAGALVAGWFWDSNDLNREADRGEGAIGAITRTVNGPAKHGLDERHERFRAAIASLARWPETLEA